MKCGTCWHLAALGGGCGAGAARGPWRGVGVGSCVPGLHEGETPGGGPALLTLRGAWQTSRYHQVGFSPGRRGRRKRSSSWLGEEGAACALGSKKGLLGLAGTHAPTGPPVWGRGRGRVREWPPRSRAGALWSGVSATPCGLCWPSSQDRSGVCSVPCLGDPPLPSSLLLPFSQCLLLPLLIPGLWGLTRLSPSPLTGGPPCRGNWFRIGDQSESFPGRFLTRIIREELAFLFKFEVIKCEPSAVGA